MIELTPDEAKVLQLVLIAGGRLEEDCLEENFGEAILYLMPMTKCVLRGLLLESPPKNAFNYLSLTEIGRAALTAYETQNTT